MRQHQLPRSGMRHDAEHQKRRFPFAYKPTTQLAGVAARPWAAWRR